MFIDQIKKFLRFFFIVLLCIIYNSSVLAQHIDKDRVDAIQKNLIGGDQNKVCKLIEKSIFQNRMYLIEDVTVDHDSADISVFTSGWAAYSDSVNVKVFKDRSPFLFEIPFGSIKIDSFKVERLSGMVRSCPFEDSWRPAEFMYVKIRIIAGIIHKPLIARIPCRKSFPGGILDKPIIPLPLTRKKLTPLTASLGTIAIGSTSWFLIERANGKKHYHRYNLATTMEHAVFWRDKVKISRTHRNIAGIIAIASDVIFGALFIRDVFFRKCENEGHCVSPSHPGLHSESRFCFRPELSNEHLTFSIFLKL